MKILGSPDTKTPLSALLVEFKGVTGQYSLVPVHLQELPEDSAVHHPSASGAPLLIFTLGLLPGQNEDL